MRERCCKALEEDDGKAGSLASSASAVEKWRRVSWWKDPGPGQMSRFHVFGVGGSPPWCLRLIAWYRCSLTSGC